MDLNETKKKQTETETKTDFVPVFASLLSMELYSQKQIAYHEYSSMENSQPNDLHSLAHDRSWSYAQRSLQFR